MAIDKEHMNTANLSADTIFIYEGADCSFDLYTDSGDGYDFENGNYDLITLTYSERSKELTPVDRSISLAVFKFL